MGWRLIDMSYVLLRTTSSRMIAHKESVKGKGDVEDHPPTFDELSVQVLYTPMFWHDSLQYIPGTSFLMLFNLPSDKCAALIPTIPSTYEKVTRIQ